MILFFIEATTKYNGEMRQFPLRKDNEILFFEAEIEAFKVMKEIRKTSNLNTSTATVKYRLQKTDTDLSAAV